MSTTVSARPPVQGDHRTEQVGDSPTSRRRRGRPVFGRLRRKPKAAAPAAVDWFGE